MKLSADGRGTCNVYALDTLIRTYVQSEDLKFENARLQKEVTQLANYQRKVFRSVQRLALLGALEGACRMGLEYLSEVPTTGIVESVRTYDLRGLLELKRQSRKAVRDWAGLLTFV